MALNKTLLYQEIYSDLASDQVKDAASHEPTAGNAIIDQLSRGILAPVMYDSDGNPLVANQSAGSKLGIDQLISSVVDRTIQHILTNLQTSEAEDQILALKDQVTALSNSVLALNSKVIELHTKLVTSHTQSALDASNILTMITAWGALNTGLATGISATMAAAVIAFNSSMSALVTSWTSIAASQTATATAGLPTLTTSHASIVSDIGAIQSACALIIEGTADSVT